MGRGWGGVAVEQRCVDHRPSAIGIAKHVIVPEPENTIALVPDHLGPECINLGRVLAAVHLNDQLRLMAGKVCDKMTDRYLSSKTLFWECFAQQAPKPAFGVGHISAKATRAIYSALWCVMLHCSRSTPTITPPQPLPIKGRGLITEAGYPCCRGG